MIRQPSPKGTDEGISLFPSSVIPNRREPKDPSGSEVMAYP
jgi:hypothetical protein